MEVQIQVASLEEIPLLVKMGKQTYRESYEQLWDDKNHLEEFLEMNFNQDLLNNEIKQLKAWYFVYHLAHSAIGFAKLRNSGPNEFIQKHCIELQKIYFYKDFTGQGQGSKLLAYVIAFAKEKGFESIWLDVLKNNLKARQVYERSGFRQIGEKSFRYKSFFREFWVMGRNLH